MSKKLLDRFFSLNDVDDEIPSAPALAHIHITLLKNPDANEKIRTLINELVFKEQPGREASAMDERTEIESAETCGQLIRIMRRNPDSVNQNYLINRALEFEEEMIPELLRMLKTSGNDGFIELAIRVLAMCEKDIAVDIIASFDDIRNPYAQSMLLVALGFLADEARIPWFIEKFDVLRSLYPDESYYEGAYFALREMYNRFY